MIDNGGTGIHELVVEFIADGDHSQHAGCTRVYVPWHYDRERRQEDAIVDAMFRAAHMNHD